MIRSKIASRFKRAKTMSFLWALLALMLHVVPGAVVPAHAQGSRKDDIVFNSRGIPLAGATVRVCAMPASGQPCTPVALIYSDAALTQALANPTATDGLGNYFFYAAPGKYEIEISGPAITTKQIPNVILPNDPASPNFSAVSAFSLTLSGNLAVSGNSTVVGNLASGTLNLANQSTPPGSASSGTVNLYTKTADKRLYYKDDTGAEVGPLGPGAQTNAINTFTANQNFDANVAFKGPNPYNDLARYGGYFNTSPPSTTASCTNASTSVTLAAALDFQDASKFPGASLGNGIVLYQCGAATGLSAPPAPTVAPFGVTNGTTTYNYKYVAEDLSGGLTAASSLGTTTTGPAALGTNTVNLTSAVWNNTLGGEQVYTCSGNCNVSVNAPINIAGFTNTHFNGNYTIIGTTSTTFTVYSPINPAPAVTSESASATVSVLACNILTMPANSVANTVEGASSDTVMRWWVYRNNAVAFTVQQRDPYYEDCGVNIPATNIPPYVPGSPGSAVNKYLATTIVSGGGTASIVVANAAGNTISGQTALHDNSQNLLACVTASRQQTPCYIPTGVNPPFNAATYFQNSIGSNAHIFIAGGVNLNQPWVLRSNGIVFEGQRNNGQTGFNFLNSAQLTGGGNNSYALPTFLYVQIPGGTGLGINFFNIQFVTFSPAGVAFNWDSNSTFGLLMDNVSFLGSSSASNLNIPSAIIRGVTQSRIGRLGDRTTCNSPQPAVLGPPCFRFTATSPAEYAGPVAIAGSLGIYGFNVTGGGASYQFDAQPWLNSGGNPTSVIGLGPVEIRDGLREEGKGPFLRVSSSLGLGPVFNIRQIDDDAPNAQPGNGFLDLAAMTHPAVVDVQDMTGNVGGQAFVAGPALVHSHGDVGHSIIVSGSQSGSTFSQGGSVTTAGAGLGMQASGVSTVGYAMPQPNAPAVNVGAHSSCSSNCVPAGTYFYAIVANDIVGHNSGVSPSTSATTDGTQTITVSWVPVGGQVSTSRGRGSAANNILLTDSLGTGIGGTSYTDLGSFFYTASLPSSSSANSSSLSSAGLAATQITLTNSGFSDTISGTISANRAQTLPDTNGVFPISSYLNSAYDNFNRANGALGSNWTAAIGTIQVSSNVAIATALTGGNASAIWGTGGAFSSNQFAQETLTTLNGATDLIGPAVRYSVAGSGYTCIESTTTLTLQRDDSNSRTTLNTSSTTGNVGDILRIEANGGTITCTRTSSAGIVTSISASDTTYAAGSPGIFFFGSVATAGNWSGGNLHPLAHLDVEQDWTMKQHFTQGVAFGTETFTASPRSEQNIFLPGALTSTWTGATWTVDKAVTITRLQVQAKTAPAGCTTSAVVRLTDGTTPVNLTISAAANDSGAISQNYAAGSSLQVLVQTAAAGCTTNPADANVTVQYRMQ